MNEKVYRHHGQSWHLSSTQDGRLCIKTGDCQVTMPSCGVLCLANRPGKNHHHEVLQICEGPDGWRIQVEVGFWGKSKHYVLILSQNDFSVTYADAPESLCLELLERLSAQRQEQVPADERPVQIAPPLQGAIPSAPPMQRALPSAPA